MAAPDLSKYLLSRVYSTLGFQCPDNQHITMGDASDASLFWNGSQVVLDGGRFYATGGVGVPDDQRFVFGTDLDASIWFDGTRLTHDNADILFRNAVSVPLIGSVETTLLGVGHNVGVLAPDRSVLVKACRLAWARVPQTSTAGDSWGLRLLRRRTGVIGTNMFQAPGTVLMSGMTSYVPLECTLTSDADILIVSSGDYVYASIDVNGVSILNTMGLTGAVTMEYEVYQ